jgi:hypothetical protein
MGKKLKKQSIDDPDWKATNIGLTTMSECINNLLTSPDDDLLCELLVDYIYLLPWSND